MGIEYTLILMDEFDWAYANTSKSEQGGRVYQSGFIVTDTPKYMMVVDIGRTRPAAAVAHLKAAGVVFDAAYYRRDNEPVLNVCD